MKILPNVLPEALEITTNMSQETVKLLNLTHFIFLKCTPLLAEGFGGLLSHTERITDVGGEGYNHVLPDSYLLTILRSADAVCLSTLELGSKEG